MEEILKQIIPGLLKTSPYLCFIGGVVYLVTKMVIKDLKERDEKKATALKEKDDKREELFKHTLEKREQYFMDEMEKKDIIIHEKDEDLKVLNAKLVDVTQKFIEVTERNNIIISNLKEVIAAMKNGNR